MEEKDSKETEKEWDGKIEETHSEKLKSEKDEWKDVDKDKIAKMATLIRAIMALKMTKEDKQPSEVKLSASHVKNNDEIKEIIYEI